MSQEIKLLLIDDHSLFRTSLSRLLQAEGDIRIAGECGSATEAMGIMDAQEVDVVLLDFDLGEEQGFAFLTQATKRGFDGRVLMVTAGMTNANTLRALQNGCSGVFLKHSPPSRLVEAIHKVAAGEVWVDSVALRSLVTGATEQAGEQRRLRDLTSRERAVLRAVFEGLANKEIASQLELSESSVKAVLQQLFAKTGVRSRSQLVRIVLEQHAHDWLSEPNSLS